MKKNVCAYFLLMCGSYPACAELYFNPALVSNDVDMVADLSRFEHEGAQLPGNYQVDIYLNGSFISVRELRFVDSGDNTGNSERYIHDRTGLMPCLTSGDLSALGVKMDKFPALLALAREVCIPPGKYIPEAYTSFSFQKMRLDISIPQAYVQNNGRGYISPERWDKGINAALLNYAFTGSNSRSDYGNSSSHYLNLNSGLNLGTWRLRDYSTWSDYSSSYSRYRKWQHIKTYVQRPVIPLRSELLLGDSTTGSDIFDSLGFRGIQIETDESMYPDNMKGFAPVIRGAASSNAQVSVRQKGYLIYQTFVSPGPFAITDLYPLTTGGDLDVTVTEAGGHTRSFQVPYATVPVMQRESYMKYSITGGRYKSSSDRYDQPVFLQGTLIWGLPHDMTVYGGMQYTDKYRAISAGSGGSLGDLGAMSVDITAANSTLADGSDHQGQSLRFQYVHAASSLGTTLRLMGYRYSSRGFYTLEDTALKGMSGWRYDNTRVDENGRPVKVQWSDYYNLYNSKRSSIQANISQTIGVLGSLYLTATRQTYWNMNENTSSVQAGFSSSVMGINYSLSWSYSKAYAQPTADKTFWFFLSAPLDRLFNSNEERQRGLYATLNSSRDNNGREIWQTGLSGSALEDGNLNWAVFQGASRDGGRARSNGNTSLSYQGGYGNSNLGYSYSDGGNRQINYGFSGGAILHRNGLTLGQPLGDTNVLVAAPGASDIRVENSIGVHTDWRGYAIVPYAQIYRDNRVALDLRDMGEHTDIDNAVSHVVPTRGALVRAGFTTHTGARVVMTLIHKGKPLPFGSMVTVYDRSGIVGDDGQVYLSGLPVKGSLIAQWGDKASRCEASWHLSDIELQSAVAHITENCQ